MKAAERRALPFQLDLVRDPLNLADANALQVIGYWMSETKRWFRAPIQTWEQAHIGFVPAEYAEQIAQASSDMPIAAELYEVAIADDPDDDPGFGVIIKMIVLIPSATDLEWGPTVRLLT